jgi:ornithine cyclodeaminase/alanine dehydrogenase-like protein (mu-crystallin family)
MTPPPRRIVRKEPSLLSSRGAPGARVVRQADAVVDLTPAKDPIIDSWSVEPGALAGLDVAPVR